MSAKILVVDDETVIVESLSEALSEKGYTVVTAQNGKNALKEAKNQGPNLILLDVQMPKMNGFEVLKRLKKDRKTMNIPVIMLTAEKTQDDIAQGIQNQADKYLTKPFKTDQVVLEVEKTLSLLQ